MRTTLTLDSDLALLLREEASRQGLPFRIVLNRTLRMGLRASAGGEPRNRFQTAARHLGLRPGVDPGRLNDVYGELETADFVAAERRRSAESTPSDVT